MIIFLIAYLLFQREYAFSEHIGIIVQKLITFKMPLSYKMHKAISLISLDGDIELVEASFINKVITAVVYSLSTLLTLIWFIKEWQYLVLISLLMIVMPFYKLYEIEKEYKEVISKTLPTLILQLDLLNGTGMPLLNVLKELTLKQENFLLKALSYDINLIQSGESMERVLITFSNRCHNIFLTRMVRIIVSDNKNGTKETRQLLRILNQDIALDKRSRTLRKGEEASAKLLLPMTLSFIGIMVVVTVPALVDLFKF